MALPSGPESPESPESAVGSADSSAASSISSHPYVEGPGPGFDPKSAPPQAPPPEVELQAPLVGWDQKKLESWLINAGDLAHATVGVADSDWEMTKADLERIAPPLTRILNRYEPLRAAAEYSDAGSVAVGFGMYGWRSTLERMQALKAIKAAEGEPDVAGSVTPVAPAEGPAVPEDYTTAADRLRATRPPEGQ